MGGRLIKEGQEGTEGLPRGVTQLEFQVKNGKRKFPGHKSYCPLHNRQTGGGVMKETTAVEEKDLGLVSVTKVTCGKGSTTWAAPCVVAMSKSGTPSTKSAHPNHDDPARTTAGAHVCRNEGVQMGA